VNTASLTTRARALPDGSIELLAPAVGLYSQAPARAALLQPGESAGVLRILGRAMPLLVPDGVRGRVAGDPPLLRRQPVEFGQVLLRLHTAAEGAAPPIAAAVQTNAGKVLRADQAGRFWRRPDPKAPEFVAEGALIQIGSTLGLLEVMKTFQPMRYKAGSGLPERARLMRWRVADGAEVKEGEALADFEPA
jgi:hypothetical protein